MENLNNNTEQQYKNLQTTTINNLSNRRQLIPLAFALVIVFFFFTFCNFECAGQKFGSVTGFNLVTGTELASRDMITGSETKGQEIPPNVWAIFAFATSIIGLGAFLIREKREAKIGTGAGIIGFGSLIILQFAIKSAIDEKSRGGVDVDFQFPYWGALISFAVAGIVSYLRMQDKHNIVVGVPLQSTLTTPPIENSSRLQTSLNSVQPSNNLDIGDWFINNQKIVNGWFRKNKKYILIAFASVVVLYGVFYFFIKNDPENDAKNAASAFCDCSTKYNDAIIKIDGDFVKSFDTYGFKKRQEARNKLQELQNSANADNSTRFSAAQLKYNDLRNRYITDQEMLSKFDFAYNSMSGTCNPSNQSQLTSMYSVVENKITAIKDPEPDIEKIKNDLIGQKIPGWNFEYLSEIKLATISNTTRSTARIEFQIDLHMVGYTKTDDSYNDAQVIVTYLSGNDGWYFNNVKEIYITYQNQILSNNWTVINPIPNCSMHVDDNQKLSWKTYDWSPEIKTGPDARNVTLPNSNTYLVKSREGHAVTVKCTYRPLN